MRTGYIYEYLSPSGKYYIGQTINLMQRLSEHRHFKTKSSLIDRAIRKYGEDNFKFKILFETKSSSTDRLKHVLNILEIYYIRKYKRLGRVLYNILDGGNQGNSPIWTDERRDKMRRIMLQRRRNGFNGNQGIKMSNETKLKLISTNSVKVIQLSKDGTVLKTWDNIASASRDLSILVTSICNCLSGRSKTAGGYRWIYYGK